MRLPPNKGDTPIFVAVAQNAEEMLAGTASELGKKRADRLAIIGRLIDAGADINARRGGKASGWTPLMMAVAQDDKEIARRLIAAGANTKNEDATISNA